MKNIKQGKIYKYKVYTLWLTETNKLCICLVYSSRIKLKCKIWKIFHHKKYWKIISKEYIKL